MPCTLAQLIIDRKFEEIVQRLILELQMQFDPKTRRSETFKEPVGGQFLRISR
jgi:hypothetical protein